jgi:hypothetical protein
MPFRFRRSFRSATALAVILTITMTGNVAAQTAMILGPGAESCGAWTADRRNASQGRTDSGLSWVLGFLSGVGVFVDDKDPLRGVDYQGVRGWIDNYRQAHPLETVSQAATHFFHAHPR